jgi:hypothetical protein
MFPQPSWPELTPQLQGGWLVEAATLCPVAYQISCKDCWMDVVIVVTLHMLFSLVVALPHMRFELQVAYH